MKLPIPFFRSVKEVAWAEDSVVLITPTYHRAARFEVIRIFTKSGRTRTIGREIDLKLARLVAERPSREDGKPVQEGTSRRPTSCSNVGKKAGRGGG